MLFVHVGTPVLMGQSGRDWDYWTRQLKQQHLFPGMSLEPDTALVPTAVGQESIFSALN